MKNKNNIRIILIIIAGFIALLIEVIKIINDKNPNTIDLGIWIHIALSVCFIIIVYLFTYWQIKVDKSNFDLKADLIKVSEALRLKEVELQKYIAKTKKIDFGLDTSYDNQFKPIFEQMNHDPVREITILNYTQTGFPENYTIYFSKVITEILKSFDNKFEFKVDFVSQELFIDWENIINNLQTIRNNGIIDIIQFKKYIGISDPSELERIIYKTLVDNKSKSINRDKYLIAETYWLLPDEKGDKVTRMYYIDPSRELPYLMERFLFACSTLINSFLSSRYKLAILPARVKNPYSDCITSYQVLHGMSSSNDDTTPQSWVFSGLKKIESPDDKLDYIFMQCENKGDSIIGTKGSHTLNLLNNIWNLLLNNDLVLFDGNQIFLKRICEFAYLISLKINDESVKRKFKIKFDAFRNELLEICKYLNYDTDCKLSLRTSIETDLIWHINDITSFNNFLSQDKSGCNSFINCNESCQV